MMTKDIEMIHKLSILHCVLQVIASADGGFVTERDQAAIDMALKELDLPVGFSLNGAFRLYLRLFYASILLK